MVGRKALAVGVAVLALSLAGCSGGPSPSDYNRQAIGRAESQQASVEAIRAALVSRLNGWTDQYGGVDFLMPGENPGDRDVNGTPYVQIVVGHDAVAAAAANSTIIGPGGTPVPNFVMAPSGNVGVSVITNTAIPVADVMRYVAPALHGY